MREMFQTEAKGSTCNMFDSYGLRLRQHYQFLTLVLFVKNSFFLIVRNKNKDYHQCQIIVVLKTSILERSAESFSRPRCRKHTATY